MEISITMDLKDFKEFIRKKQDNARIVLPEALRKATLYLHNQVKTSIARGTNAPVAVDTGRFLNSVDFDSSGNESRVFTDLEYAKFIEYGTSKMEARPHFRNTTFVEKHKIRDDMGAEVKSI